MTEKVPASRRTWGMPLGVVLAVLVFFLAGHDGDALSSEGRAVAAVGVLMATLWITESLPIPATSLLPLALFPLLGVGTFREAAAPYAHPLIFLFMGGFMLAMALESVGLHRRLALVTLRRTGTTPHRLVLGFMLASAFLSMWISNTATTVMMLPIAMSVLAVLDRRDSGLGPALMLGIAYAASIGGIATLIGTPPNAFLAGFLESTYGVHLGFGRWLLVGLPLSVVMLPLAWLLLTRVLHPLDRASIAGGGEVIRGELAALGPMSPAERRVAVVFVCTALAWIVREPLASTGALAERLPVLERVTDSGIAVAAALVLFALPRGDGSGHRLLRWAEAARIPWGVLVLFGGGLSLAWGVRATGLDAWLGGPATRLVGAPPVVLVIVVVALIVFLTEVTSNTATAATFLPILGAAAVAAGLAPQLLVIPAAIAASCAFMLPVATPPNAIVFGSGQVTMRDMVRAGIGLNLVAIVLVTLVAFVTVPFVR